MTYYPDKIWYLCILLAQLPLDAFLMGGRNNGSATIGAQSL